MSIMKKTAGLVIGLSTVAAIGVAVAQGVPPNPYISNPALGAGQQSAPLTPMGETGVNWQANEVRQALIVTPVQETPVAAAEPAPAPAQEAQVMGAAPAEQAAAPAPVVEERVARADRN